MFDKRLIRQNEDGCERFLPIFGIVITRACFRKHGKWLSFRQEFMMFRRNSTALKESLVTDFVDNILNFL